MSGVEEVALLNPNVLGKRTKPVERRCGEEVEDIAFNLENNFFSQTSHGQNKAHYVSQPQRPRQTHKACGETLRETVLI